MYACTIYIKPIINANGRARAEKVNLIYTYIDCQIISRKFPQNDFKMKVEMLVSSQKHKYKAGICSVC